MQTLVKWQQNVAFNGYASGHQIPMDGPESSGGINHGPRPMELLLLGIGGCSSYDVTQMLIKGRQDIQTCEVVVSAERADAIPAIFTAIHLAFQISGKDLNQKKIERAVQLSAEKYCSASILMQNAGVNVTHSVEIVATTLEATQAPAHQKPPPGLQGLHHIALFVNNFEACLDFYANIIGMEIEWQPDSDNVYLCSGKDNFALHRASQDLAPASQQKLDHLGFVLTTIESVKKWCDYLRHQGVQIQNEPRTHRDGATSFYALDPDKNLVQFIHHPPISGQFN